MVIINDDTGDREIPREVRTAESFNLIIQYHQPKFWTPSNSTFSPFLTVNGIANNPTLAIRQLKWMRLRMLSVGVSFGGLITSQIILAERVACTFTLIAKDGVYLGTPRPLQEPYTMVWTESSRSDLMVRCDGPVGSTVQFLFNNMPMMRLRIDERNEDERPDAFNIHYETCLPRYLKDTFADVVTPPRVSVGPILSYSGDARENALAVFTVGQTIEMLLAGSGHPFHTHINHYQIQEDDASGWYRRGDWHDTVENAIVRMRLDRWTKSMLVHCQ